MDEEVCGLPEEAWATVVRKTWRTPAGMTHYATVRAGRAQYVMYCDLRGDPNSATVVRTAPHPDGMKIDSVTIEGPWPVTAMRMAVTAYTTK